MLGQIYKLSPSDFAYLFQDCKYCYIRKIKESIVLPSMPMPGVFTAINSRIQGNMVGKNLKDMFPDLPDGEVVKQEGFVESGVIPGTGVFIKGKYDLLVKNPDGTHIIVDLKLSQPGEDKVEKYATQLYAYKYAFENPKFGDPIKISKLSLLIFYPDQTSIVDGKVSLNFPHTWLEVPIDDAKFMEFIKSVDSVLLGELPEPTQTCSWCMYRARFEEKIQEELPF